MGNKAIVAKIDAVIEIPGADKIHVAKVLGESVVVSKEWGVGFVGILFPVGVALSEKMVYENSLSRNSNNNKDVNTKGFFEDSRRVRAQPFLKVKSEGFFTHLNAVAWAGGAPDLGVDFDVLNGHKICEKYISEETRKAMKGGTQKQSATKKVEAPFFDKHVDSDQFRHFAQNIPTGALLSFHAKVHGTSHRSGLTLLTKTLPKWKQLVNKVVKIFPDESWEYVVGTRNVLLKEGDGGKEGFHGVEQYRFDIADQLKPYMEKGMIVYGEIAGFANGKSIMPQHGTKALKDKAFTAKYGENMTYSYGCKSHENRFHIYRITRLTHDGKNIDMSQKEMEQWCSDRGLLTTLEVHPQMVYNGDIESLRELVESLTERPELLTEDFIDPSHISEGVILRVDSGNYRPKFYKHKSYAFRVLEGLCETVDTEDAS